ncbi:MAG TPA: hypothetical protein PLB41_12485 [Rubrivivax sp.]|nr:hypothetical protein [Rubrivivax sp.]HPO19564.1 hypothetical protein [Rubrivivax sp.]
MRGFYALPTRSISRVLRALVDTHVVCELRKAAAGRADAGVAASSL